MNARMITMARVRNAMGQRVAVVVLSGAALIAGIFPAEAVDATFFGSDNAGGNSAWGRAASWTPGVTPNGAEYNVYIGAAPSARLVQINQAVNYTAGSVFFGSTTTTDTFTIGLNNAGNLSIANHVSIDAASTLTAVISSGSTGKLYLGVSGSGSTNTWTNNSAKTADLRAVSVFADTASGDRTWVIGGSGNWNFTSTTANAAVAATIGSELTGGKKAILRKEGSGTLTVSSSNTFVGQVDVAGGNFVVGNNRALGDASNAVNVTGGTLSLTSFTSTIGTLSVDGGSISATSGSLHVSAVAAKSGTIGASLTGTGALNKTSGSTVTLTQANTYSGGTTVSAGTLLLSGSGSLGSGNVVMAGGELDISAVSGAGYATGIAQTLSGNGSILATGKVLTVNGVLDPGALGLNVEGGTLALTETASYVFTLTSPGLSDAISLTAGASLNIGDGVMGFSDFTFLEGIGFTGGTYVLFAGAADLIGSLDGLDLTGTVGTQSAVLGVQGDNIVLNVDPVPEPSVIALIGAGLAGLAFIRRRIRRP